MAHYALSKRGSLLIWLDNEMTWLAPSDTTAGPSGSPSRQHPRMRLPGSEWTRYHARSRVEAKMRCLKPFGERIAARDPDTQTAEIHICIALINRFNALGTAEIVCVA